MPIAIMRARELQEQSQRIIWFICHVIHIVLWLEVSIEKELSHLIALNIFAYHTEWWSDDFFWVNKNSHMALHSLDTAS